MQEPTEKPPLHRAAVAFPPLHDCDYVVCILIFLRTGHTSSVSSTSATRAVPEAAAKNTSSSAKYDPKDTSFPFVSDIPTELLAAVAECFQQRMLVCRTCFFESRGRELSSKRERKNMCEKSHLWKQVKVIPACRLCVGSVLFVAIHPVPKHMQHSTTPFLVCKKGDHQTCHHMSRTTNPWFPHTVEELVIWTVEREKSEAMDARFRSQVSFLFKDCGLL